jgi:hypothetical protein
MIEGLTVKIPLATKGMNLKNQEAKIISLCKDGLMVYLDTGYFYRIKDLVFLDSELEDPILFSKCIDKHGSLLKALKNSLI